MLTTFSSIGIGMNDVFTRIDTQVLWLLGESHKQDVSGDHVKNPFNARLFIKALLQQPVVGHSSVSCPISNLTPTRLQCMDNHTRTINGPGVKPPLMPERQADALSRRSDDVVGRHQDLPT
jgi:hypothetical protein